RSFSVWSSPSPCRSSALPQIWHLFRKDGFLALRPHTRHVARSRLTAFAFRVSALADLEAARLHAVLDSHFVSLFRDALSHQLRVAFAAHGDAVVLHPIGHGFLAL